MKQSHLARLLLAVGLFALMPAVAQAKRVTIKMATLAPKGSVFHEILEEMANAWKEASDGKVRVRIYAGGVAGDDPQVVRKMRLGSLNAGLLTSGGLSEIDKAVHALMIPGAYKTVAEYDAVLERLRGELNQIYDAKGFVVLGWMDAGWIRFFTKGAARTPAEVGQTQKLWVSAGDTNVVEIWKQAGFNVVPLPSTEIATALQTGLVTAIPAPPQAAMLMQYQKHTDHMIETPWAPLAGALVVKKDAWEKIEPGVREKLAAAATSAIAKLRADARPNEQKAIDAMAERGLKVVTLSAEEDKAWRDSLAKARDKIRGAWVQAELFDKVQAILAELRK